MVFGRLNKQNSRNGLNSVKKLWMNIKGRNLTQKLTVSELKNGNNGAKAYKLLESKNNSHYAFFGPTAIVKELGDNHSMSSKAIMRPIPPEL